MDGPHHFSDFVIILTGSSKTGVVRVFAVAQIGTYRLYHIGSGGTTILGFSPNNPIYFAISWHNVVEFL